MGGVQINQLTQIFDERGKVMHMLRADTETFKQLGEIYFLVRFPVVKAWHLHKEMMLNYAVINGNIKLVLYDNRCDSSTKGQ